MTAVWLLFAAVAPASQIPISQHASVTQRIGQTEIAIVYNRPSARGRRLFGGIVKWRREWCPGADSATTIAFNTDVLVAGHRLAAGKYSLWAIPDTSDWTLIFSRAANVFHLPYPGSDQDALRIEVKPQSGPFVETLAFYFPAADPQRALLNLHWGETIVQVALEPLR